MKWLEGTPVNRLIVMDYTRIIKPNGKENCTQWSLSSYFFFYFFFLDVIVLGGGNRVSITPFPQDIVYLIEYIILVLRGRISPHQPLQHKKNMDL